MRAGQRTLGIGFVMLVMVLVFVGQGVIAASLTRPVGGTNVRAWLYFSQDWIVMGTPLSEAGFDWRLTNDGWGSIPYVSTFKTSWTSPAP